MLPRTNGDNQALQDNHFMQSLLAIALLVPDYDEGIDFYVGRLGFTLVEDRPLSAVKRWVCVRPPGAHETCLLLAKAEGNEQRSAIGRQAGGRVFLFLRTEDFNRDYRHLQQRGVEFLESPRQEDYGMVAVFRDPFGNRWDLIQQA